LAGLLTLAARGAPIANATSLPATGPVELEFVLPAGRPGTGEPLVVAGELGRSDTIFVYYVAPGQVRFGWDSAADGVVYSPIVPAAGTGPHRLLVALGSLLPAGSDDPAAPPSAETLLRGLLLLEFDGRTIFRSAGDFSHGAGPSLVTLGANRAGSALVHPFFTGEIVALRPVPAARALAEAMQVGRWTAALAGETARYPGAVRLRVRFPRAAAAAADPLIVTGRTGVGDFLYVLVLDPQHLRFGFDHWAVGGMVSPPVAVDLAAVHELVLTMGALYAPADASAGPWRSQVAVWLDGRRVLSGPSDSHPTTAGEIILGYNLIGGSTAAPAYRGLILGVQTVSPAELGKLPR
jgi:hypothetical protein